MNYKAESVMVGESYKRVDDDMNRRKRPIRTRRNRTSVYSTGFYYGYSVGVKKAEEHFMRQAIKLANKCN